MNTLLYISLIACVCLAYYATALPQPAEEVESNDAKLNAEVESLLPAEDRYKRSPNRGYGGGYYGGGHRGGHGHGGGRGGGYGRGGRYGR